MSNLLTKNFRIATSKAFLDQVTSNKSNLYFFMGKVTPWPDESSSLPPVDNSKYFSQVYDNIIAAKRVQPQDVKPVVRRINWEKNRSYAEYDDQDDFLLEKDFYVLNSEFNVYKCIDNNNNNLSTVEPTGTSLRIFTTSDRYRWKFLYSINLQDQLKFLTRSWMPVSTDSLVKNFAIDGGIENVKIYNSGIDYSARTKIEVIGDQIASANISARVRLGSIIDYQIFDSGRGYRNSKTELSFVGPGRFANVRAIISPVNGHGYDPITELGTSHLMFYTFIENNEGQGAFLSDVSFRQVGLLTNPTFRNSSNIASNTIISFVDNLILNEGNGSFVRNEYLRGQSSGANLYCISANLTLSPNVIDLAYVQSSDVTENFITPNVGEIVVGITSGATGRVTAVRNSNFSDDLGEILYVENFAPIARNIDQTESLHLVIEF